MKSLEWQRGHALDHVKADVWRYLTQASTQDDQLALEAAALLQMDASAVRRLGQVQFLLSDPVGRLLEQMPSLIRRLKTTSLPEEERSAERVRGAVHWPRTISEQYATCLPVFVTFPAARAFQTPENELLVTVLDSISSQAKRLAWRGKSGPATLVRERGETAEHWLQTRALTQVRRVEVTPRSLTKVRTGRAARRYAPAVEAFQLLQAYLRRADREAIRRAVEEHALLATADDVLLEVMVVFGIERALEAAGWTLSRPGLVQAGPILRAKRSGTTVDVFYQRAPKALAIGSRYQRVQAVHSFRNSAPLRPDFVMRIRGSDQERWIVGEVKGVERAVEKSARAAILDLLAYRRAFDTVLATQDGPYGLGVAWGQALTPRAESEIVLCSPDTIPAALENLLAQSPA